MSIIQCDGKFDFLFYDIKVQLFPENHAISGQVEFNIRNLVDNTNSLRLTLLSTLEISRLIAQGDDLTYERHGRHELTIHLKKTLNEGDEQTFRIDYSGEMIADREGYDGYVGEEGIFMRPFAAWYPYGTGKYGWYDFPDVPYVLEARAPLGWTLFAHPDSPQVEQEADQVVYRWDGRQPHQRRPIPWGIALFGGKYHKIERKIGEHSITFFALEKSDRRMEKIISNLSELWSKLDEFSNMPSSPRQIRLAEHADSLVMTYQPAHTSFSSSRSFNSLWDMAWSSIWDDVYRWEAFSEANWLEPLEDELAFHLRQWFFADDDRSPEGWLAADLERLLRAYLGVIQTKVYLKLTWNVRNTKGAWAWWIWRRIVGDEAFSRAIHRLRTGAFPKDTVIGSKEFFALTSDETGIPSDWFWEQWMGRTSAPLIAFERVSVEEKPGGFVVDVVLSQPGEVYRLPLDIVLRTNEEEICQSIFMNERDHHLAFHCKGKPNILEIDPEQKIMKLPYGDSTSRIFKYTDLGFAIAFSGVRRYGLEDEALLNGKRIVIAPTELLDVAESLKPYLQTSWGTPKERNSTEVEIYSPDEVTEELLENHNLVLIGNPKNNPLIEKMAISTMKFRQDKISAGEAIIEDEKQALIAFGENPKNDERFCLVVTALSNEALKNPPDFTEMPGDYLIYQDGKPIKVGFQRPYRWVYRIP